jgi:hypothetical protein
MVRLAAQLLEAELVIVPRRHPTFLQRFLAMLPRSRGNDACLLICPSPAYLSAVLQIEGWRRRYGQLVAWVFDSFWVNVIPRFARVTRHFDHVFVTENEDIEAWRRLLRAPVDWLPWGTDALNLGSAASVRPFDVVRAGRQPPEWEDDETSTRACDELNLRFAGRPPRMDDAGDNERLIMKTFAQSKFTLSFSNTVSPSVQTYSKRQYITARWTDALAAGATVAGVPPKCDTVRDLFWDGALLDTGTVERKRGLEVIASAAQAWTAERAQLNHVRALERLDWRWRFKQLATTLGLTAAPLVKELERLAERISNPARG